MEIEKCLILFVQKDAGSPSLAPGPAAAWCWAGTKLGHLHHPSSWETCSSLGLSPSSSPCVHPESLALNLNTLSKVQAIYQCGISKDALTVSKQPERRPAFTLKKKKQHFLLQENTKNLRHSWWGDREKLDKVSCVLPLMAERQWQRKGQPVSRWCALLTVTDNMNSNISVKHSKCTHNVTGPGKTISALPSSTFSLGIKYFGFRIIES